jgi:glycosyltransferase involved in cell wall biosynthesis
MIPALNEHEKWQLAIWGTGPLLETLPQHPQIVYHGFTQPESLKKVWSNLDVFILPSKYEPWGVVVHEAASAGLPLVVTTAVGAGDQFIQSSVNGFIFPVGDYAAMQEGLKNIQHWSREEKRNAKEISLKLAAQISQVQWSENLDKMSKR